MGQTDRQTDEQQLSIAPTFWWHEAYANGHNTKCVSCCYVTCDYNFFHLLKCRLSCVWISTWNHLAHVKTNTQISFTAVVFLSDITLLVGCQE